MMTEKRFMHRYFIDKFRKGKKVEYQLFSIQLKGRGVKGSKPLTSKTQLLKQVGKVV